MSRYTRGRSLEYEIAALFRSAGYSIIRGASSKGEFALGLNDRLAFKTDLIATKIGRDERTVYVVLMQCKRRKG
jgi:Holliday junction resolvase